jgi:hypothetical protein
MRIWVKGSSIRVDSIETTGVEWSEMKWYGRVRREWEGRGMRRGRGGGEWNVEVEND